MSDPVLYVVSTPIGNLGDMTPRAVDVLRSVSVIAAEDTRHSKKLMQHFGIDTPMLPCHDHNESQQTAHLIEKMRNGSSVALISDAGTPLVSDPGYYLVRAVRDAGFEVKPIPGCCALIAALSVSGLATDRFYFEGFLPAKASARKKRLEGLSELTHTWIVYESRHRILDCLADIRTILGETRYIVLAREITKTFETVIAGSVADVETKLRADSNQCRGEFVMLIEGFKSTVTTDIDTQTKQLLERLIEEMPGKKAAAILADVTGYRKKQLYDLAVMLMS